MASSIKSKSGSSVRGRPQLRREEKVLRRNHFLAAAADCFARKGLEATTMEEVARRAGYSPGSLYLYFKDKRELFQAVFEERIAELMVRVAGCRDTNDPAESVTKLVRVIFEHWEAKRDRCRKDRAHTPERASFEWNIREQFGQRVYEHYLKYLDFVEVICRDGVHCKVFSGQPRLLAHFLVGMMNSTVFHWMRSNMKGSLPARTDEVVAFFLQGASSRNDQSDRRARGPGSRRAGGRGAAS